MSKSSRSCCESSGIGCGQSHARKLADGIVGRERLGAEERAELRACRARERDAAFANVVLAHERDRVGD